MVCVYMKGGEGGEARIKKFLPALVIFHNSNTEQSAVFPAVEVAVEVCCAKFAINAEQLRLFAKTRDNSGAIVLDLTYVCCAKTWS